MERVIAYRKLLFGIGLICAEGPAERFTSKIVREMFEIYKSIEIHEKKTIIFVIGFGFQ